MHKEYSKILGRFMRNTGIDFIIPCDTALENLRASSVANTPNEGTGASENLISRYGFNYDAAHTAFGVAAYTAVVVRKTAINIIDKNFFTVNTSFFR